MGTDLQSTGIASGNDCSIFSRNQKPMLLARVFDLAAFTHRNQNYSLAPPALYGQAHFEMFIHGCDSYIQIK
jgi:hypothetical protein